MIYAAHLASIRQMSSQVLRGTAGEYQAPEQEGVARSRIKPSWDKAAKLLLL